MIPERYITEWSEQAPWVVNKFIEQDLIVCCALVSIYSDAFLAEHLAFNLNFFKERIRLIRIKDLITVHHRHQILSLREIDDIVCITW